MAMRRAETHSTRAGVFRYDTPLHMTMLKRGSSGEAVKALQSILGLDADGIFGPGTEVAVKEHQKGGGLDADGIVGPATLHHLDLFS